MIDFLWHYIDGAGNPPTIQVEWAGLQHKHRANELLIHC
jgi:hypothetical protein